MPAGRQRVVEAAVELLGPTEVLADRSWPHGEAVVLELWSGGRRVIGKAYGQRAKFDNERTVYRTWVPAIADRAPELLGADPGGEVLLFSHVDGRSAEDVDRDDAAELHRRAGALLARFHAAAPPKRLDGFLDGQRRRLEAWVRRARPGVLGDDEIAVVTQHLGTVDGVPDPWGVPCHRDWQPRNWLIDRHGDPWAFDFEHARVGPWFEDVLRLWWDDWRATPALADSFFDGYGRRLDGEDARWLQAISALWHLTTIVWADEHDDGSFVRTGRARLRSMAGG